MIIGRLGHSLNQRAPQLSAISGSRGGKGTVPHFLHRPVTSLYREL
jgi:hypothetical protein